MTHRSSLLLATLLAIVCLPGCLRSITTITVRKNGSATMVDSVMFTRSSVEMTREMAALAGEPAESILADTWSEDYLREYAATLGNGTKLVSVTPLTKDGGYGYVATYSIADVNTFKYNLRGVGDKLKDNKAEASPDAPAYMRLSMQKGTLTIDCDPFLGSEMVDDITEQRPESMVENMAMVERLVGDLHLALRIGFDGTITETDATYRNGSMITLIDLPFEPFIKAVKDNPHAFVQHSMELKGASHMTIMRYVDDLSPDIKLESRSPITVR